MAAADLGAEIEGWWWRWEWWEGEGVGGDYPWGPWSTPCSGTRLCRGLRVAPPGGRGAEITRGSARARARAGSATG